MQKLNKVNRTYAAVLFIVVFAVLSVSATLARAQSANMGIRVGEYSKYTRIVFDWSKLVGYSLKQTDGGFDITFNMSAEGRVKSPSLKAASKVSSIAVSNSTDGQTVVSVKTNKGAQFKDFRIVRRVVVDVYGGQKIAPKVQEKPVEKPEKQVQSQQPAQSPEIAEKTAPIQDKGDKIHYGPKVTAAPVEPVDVVETNDLPPAMDGGDDKTLQENLAKAVSEQMTQNADQISVDKIETENQQPVTQTQPTIITVSMIEPTGLAVFERFGYLWLVMDSSLSTIEPERFGPVAGYLGRPDIYELKGGVAYRYRMPQEYFVSVRRENLAWQVILSDVETPIFSDAYIEAEFNEQGADPKLVAYIRGISKGLWLKDPAVGDEIYVVPTKNPDQVMLDKVQSVDVESIPTYLGFAAVPKRDDLKFSAFGRLNRVQIYADQGLSLTSASHRIAEIKSFIDASGVDDEGDDEEKRLFNLRAWQKGGAEEFANNKREYTSLLSTLTDEQEISDTMLQLALLHFANGFGHETLGYLNVVQGYNKNIDKRASFLAIRGAANALSGRYEDAIRDLETPALQHQDEAKLWRGYAAAATEQWRLAEKLFPKTNVLLDGYPQKLAIPLTLYMAESALRSGDPQRASKFLESLDVFGDGLEVRHRAALKYLRGEMFRQNDQPKKALSEWTWVSKARDRLYSTKARLAKTMLELSEEIITSEEALDRLENNMRFAWRDDGLETQILQNIGMLRIKTGHYYDGLVQLKDTIRLASYNLIDTDFIVADMTSIFRHLFVDGSAQNIPALEAITIYNEFPELMPSGKDGVKAALNFAEYLVRVDLLDKAAQAIEDVLKRRDIDSAQVPVIGARLAAIYLLDDEPNKAISALQRTGRKSTPKKLYEERQLLRARALSQLDMMNEAIAVLEDMDSADADRLRADIYWRAQQWEKSAIALFRLVPNPNTAKRLSPEEASYVLNAAVALKISGDTKKLDRLKNDFGDHMQRTSLANSFNVVTRAAGRTTLSDRETMLNIAAEVDMFKGFLDTYRNGADGGS